MQNFLVTHLVRGAYNGWRLWLPTKLNEGAEKSTIRSKAKISSVNPLDAIKNGAAKPQFSLIADH